MYPKWIQIHQDTGSIPRDPRNNLSFDHLKFRNSSWSWRSWSRVHSCSWSLRSWSCPGRSEGCRGSAHGNNLRTGRRCQNVWQPCSSLNTGSRDWSRERCRVCGNGIRSVSQYSTRHYHPYGTLYRTVWGSNSGSQGSAILLEPMLRRLAKTHLHYLVYRLNLEAVGWSHLKLWQYDPTFQSHPTASRLSSSTQW